MPLENFTKGVERKVKGAFSLVLCVLIGRGRKAQVPPLDQMTSVLVIRPDRLGDMILSAPAVALLRKRLRQARITVVLGAGGRDVAGLLFKDVDVLCYDPRNMFSRLNVLFSLLRRRFDAAIDLHSFPFSMSSGLMALASGARVRIGFTETQHVKNPLAPRIFGNGIALNDDRLHEKEKNILLVEALGIARDTFAEEDVLRIELPDEAKERAAKFYLGCGIKDDDKVIGIHPTLRKKDNTWEMKKYRDFVSKMIRAPRVKIVVVRGKGEDRELAVFMDMVKGIEGVFPVTDADLGFLLAIGERFDCLVCNDSGIMHAESLVSDVVAIFGPSDPRRWGPIGLHRRVTLRKSHTDCNAVGEDEAVDAVEKLIFGRQG
jgi:heptosyltransferase-3